MAEHDKQKRMVRWRCNRGMLELDLLLIPFAESHFDTLNDDEKALFIEMLTYEDPILYGWLMGHEVVNVEKMQAIVKRIRAQQPTII